MLGEEAREGGRESAPEVLLLEETEVLLEETEVLLEEAELLLGEATTGTRVGITTTVAPPCTGTAVVEAEEDVVVGRGETTPVTVIVTSWRGSLRAAMTPAMSAACTKYCSCMMTSLKVVRVDELLAELGRS